MTQLKNPGCTDYQEGAGCRKGDIWQGVQDIVTRKTSYGEQPREGQSSLNKINTTMADRR